MLDRLLSAFPPNEPDSPPPASQSDPYGNRQPSDVWEPIHVLVISSPAGVREVIYELHQRGFAEVGAWSSLQPAPHDESVMSILTKRRAKRE